jgi:hypothetical protein
MTKILFIPNGSYILFFKDASLNTFSELEYLTPFEKRQINMKDVNSVVKFLNDTSEYCRDWYSINNVEIKHHYLTSEIEMVYD